MGVRVTVVKVRVSPGQYSKEQLSPYTTTHTLRLPESYQGEKKKKKKGRGGGGNKEKF